MSRRRPERLPAMRLISAPIYLHKDVLTMGITPSGINAIDALIMPGIHWGRTGQAFNFTYSLNTAGSSRLNTAQFAMVREAFRQWSKVANVTFTQVRSGGHFRIGGQPGTGGVARWTRTSRRSDQLESVDILLGDRLGARARSFKPSNPSCL